MYSTFVSPQGSSKEMVGLRLALGCLLHFGGVLAFDYAYEVPSVPKILQDVQGTEEIVASQTTESEFANRQGFYQPNPYERQDGLVTSIPLLVALGVGGIVAGAAVVQNANQARDNLQSQLDTINTRITSSSNSVSSLSSSLSSLTSTTNINTARAIAACSIVANGAAVTVPTPPPATDPTVQILIDGLVMAIGTITCP